MSSLLEKDQAHQIIDRLPANATWEDLIHEIYVRSAIERGMDDSQSGRVMEVRELRKQYGLPE